MGLFSIFKLSKRVYFPGCNLYFKNKSHLETYSDILYKIGIDFKFVEKKICCGLPALELGYDSEARKIARRNFEIFKEENIGEIITSDPGCYKMFLKDYPNLVLDWNIKVENFWKLVLEKLESKPGLIKIKSSEAVTYQDNCYLGRHLGIYEEPRKILELLGYEIKEMFDSKEESICCGSCGQLSFTNIDMANEIARERILQAKRIGVSKIITSSIADYELLKNNSEGKIEIWDLSHAIGYALGIRSKEDDFKKEVEDEEILDKIHRDFEDVEINKLVGGRE